MSKEVPAPQSEKTPEKPNTEKVINDLIEMTNKIDAEKDENGKINWKDARILGKKIINKIPLEFLDYKLTHLEKKLSKLGGDFQSDVIGHKDKYDNRRSIFERSLESVGLSEKEAKMYSEKIIIASLAYTAIDEAKESNRRKKNAQLEENRRSEEQQKEDDSKTADAFLEEI